MKCQEQATAAFNAIETNAYLLQAPGLAVDLNRLQMLEELTSVSELCAVTV